VAAVSARSYLRHGNLNILLLGTAVLVAGLASIAAGPVLSVQTPNYSVTIHNVGFFVSSVLQILSAALIFSGTKSTGLTKRRFALAVSYSLTTFFVIALTALTLLGITPTFFATEGPTLLRQSVVAITITLFTLSCLILFRSYLQSKSRVLYWYSLALGLFATGFLSLTLQIQAGDGYSWISKIAQYAGGVYFILAVLSSRTKEDSAGFSENWTEAFRFDREQFAALFSNMLDAFIYCKIVVEKNGKPVDWVFLDVNDAYAQVAGLKKEKIVGKRVNEVFPEEQNDPADWIGKYGRVALTGEPTHFESFRQSLKKWLNVSAYSPKKGYFIAIFEDITERKQAEEALGKSEQRYHQLFTSMTEMFQIIELIYDKDGKAVDYYYCDVNPAFEQLVGKTREQLVDKRVKEVFGIVEDHWIAVYDEVAKTGKSTHYENYGVELDKYYEIYAWKADEKKVAITFTDITLRKKAEEELKRSTEQARQGAEELEKLMDIIPAAVWVSRDSQCENITGNQAANTFYEAGNSENVSAGPAKGGAQDLTRRFFKGDKELKPQELPMQEAAAKNIEIRNSEIDVLVPSGRKITILGNAKPLLDDKGEVRGCLAVFMDITERKKMQTKLEEYAKNLERLVEERTKQLKDSERLAAIGATAGMVGHDIRNPLQAITSDVYLAKTELASISESDEKKNALESLQEIEKNTDYINKIVADLQDFARPLNPHAEVVDLKLIIDELLKKNGLPENVKVSVKVESEARVVLADSTFINRILYNLVNNAVQAMPKGGKLTIHAYKEANDVIITVKDTGVGIPEKIKGKLFTPMFTTKAKGQGFGLPVVKRMTEALGGTVTFESQEGKGTTFIVRLPPPQKLKGKWVLK
jgi:PAS domain S-box-containing protein